MQASYRKLTGVSTNKALLDFVSISNYTRELCICLRIATPKLKLAPPLFVITQGVKVIDFLFNLDVSSPYVGLKDK